MVLVIRRELRRDERGVASTVGTIMALLVFLTFMSLIVNQYVPVWMKDSEASHMDGTVGQFADLKGAIDFQVLGAIMAQNAGAVFVPSTASSPVTMGIDGVPIFSGPTFGSLTSSPTCGAPVFCNWSLAFTYSINNVPIAVASTSSGQIDLSVSNRYYPTGDIGYDNGAIIRSQSDGQVIVAAPILSAARSGTSLNLSFELVNLYGPGSASGTTTQIVNTNVFGVNQQTYTNVASGGAGVSIWHFSTYARAWFNFFNSTLSSELKVTTPSSYSVTGAGAVITVISPYYKIVLNTVQQSVLLLINPAGYSLTFTLRQAYVNVGIGSGSTMV
jgi:hypothetical protein